MIRRLRALAVLAAAAPALRAASAQAQEALPVRKPWISGPETGKRRRVTRKACGKLTILVTHFSLPISGPLNGKNNFWTVSQYVYSHRFKVASYRLQQGSQIRLAQASDNTTTTNNNNNNVDNDNDNNDNNV